MTREDKFLVRVVDHRLNVIDVADFRDHADAKQYAAHAVTKPGELRGAMIYQCIEVAWTPVPEVNFARDPSAPPALPHKGKVKA